MEGGWEGEGPIEVGTFTAHTPGMKEGLPLITTPYLLMTRDPQNITAAFMFGGKESMPLLTVPYVMGAKESLALLTVIYASLCALHPNVLYVNPVGKVVCAVSFKFVKWNDITDAQISTTTVTGMVLDVGLQTSRNHMKGDTVNRDTLKLGDNGTANAPSQTDVLSVVQTWLSVSKSKPSVNQVNFDGPSLLANRYRPPEPAPGGSNSVTVREGSITNYGRATTSILLTWTKNGAGADTVKESMHLWVTVTFTRFSSPVETRIVDQGLTNIADGLLNNSVTMITHMALGTGIVNPTNTDTTLGTETGTRTTITKTAHDTNGTFLRISGRFAAGDVNATVTECGTFNASTGGNMFVRCKFTGVLDDAAKFHITDSLIELSR